MKILLLCILLFCLETNSWKIFHNGRMVGGNLGKSKIGKRIATSVTRNIEEEWFTQKLDHFNPTDERTWQQRYYTNDEYFDPEAGGPVFVMLGAEGEASAEWMKEGAWVTYAKAYGALLFQVEHRYYGKSHPTENLTTENLQYLTSQQAIADIATFITAINQKHKFSSVVKWIAFGGSYAGSLAAWLRFKYPHLVHGAVASSAPLLAEVNFFNYFKVVSESLATYSDDCVTSVQHAINQIGVLLKHQIGQKNLNQIFNLCDPIQNAIQNDDDIIFFYVNIAMSIAGVVQFNKANRNGITDNVTIDGVCAIMVNNTIGPPINRLGTANDLLLKTHNTTCLNYDYQAMIDDLRNVSWDGDAAEGRRQWMYQTCTEFGFFQTSEYEPHIFGDQFPVSFFIKQCRDIFGDIFDEDFIDAAVNSTNIFYGGLNIETSNVVFVHGAIDPWHPLGILKTVNVKAPAIFIEGAAHCADLYGPKDTDLPELKTAREQIQSLIGTWLSS